MCKTVALFCNRQVAVYLFVGNTSTVGLVVGVVLFVVVAIMVVVVVVVLRRRRSRSARFYATLLYI